MVPRVAPFETHHRRYEDWFERHTPAYYSELLAIRAFLPWSGRGLEVGVGSGRFAAPLGAGIGVDPSGAMLAYARSREVQAVQGIAEELPFTDAVFAYALIVTTICPAASAPWVGASTRRAVHMPSTCMRSTAASAVLDARTLAQPVPRQDPRES